MPVLSFHTVVKRCTFHLIQVHLIQVHLIQVHLIQVHLIQALGSNIDFWLIKFK